jgi:hypothetical protein
MDDPLILETYSQVKKLNSSTYGLYQMRNDFYELHFHQLTNPCLKYKLKPFQIIDQKSTCFKNTEFPSWYEMIQNLTDILFINHCG